jgi:hypothetical protein
MDPELRKVGWVREKDLLMASEKLRHAGWKTIQGDGAA